MGMQAGSVQITHLDSQKEQTQNNLYLQQVKREAWTFILVFCDLHADNLVPLRQDEPCHDSPPALAATLCHSDRTSKWRVLDSFQLGPNQNLDGPWWWSRPISKIEIQDNSLSTVQCFSISECSVVHCVWYLLNAALSKILYYTWGSEPVAASSSSGHTETEPKSQFLFLPGALALQFIHHTCSQPQLY